MGITRNDLIDLINVLSKVLGDLSDEQFNNLVSENGNLIYMDKRPGERIFEVSCCNHEGTLNALNDFKSREEAAAYLNALKFKKDDLIKLGTLTNANITSKDTKQRIVEKIVEATVGSRLRSEAIMEINLSRKIKKR